MTEYRGYDIVLGKNFYHVWRGKFRIKKFATEQECKAYIDKVED